MAITYEDILKANKELASVPIKGKDYVQVNERVKAFRQICPGGSIQTSIISLENGVVTMQAEVTDDDGNVLATGWAQEKETSSFINKTSFIENCETSAVGRALGFAGIGIDASMCSAEELVNAVTNQNKGASNTISKKEVEVLKALCQRKGVPDGGYRGKKMEALTGDEYMQAIRELDLMKDKA